MDAASVTSDELSDYDVVSNPGYKSMDSSIADLVEDRRPTEPTPASVAKERFHTVGLTPEDIQAYVKSALERQPAGPSYPNPHATVRVYVDGVFDSLTAAHALQLRQAKLSFPTVILLVGVLPDDPIAQYGPQTTVTHVERCELVRHCRWVDEVVEDAPWTLDKAFLVAHRIDFVAVDEGASVDPTCHKARLQGYDVLKLLGKVIPTRRTIGMAPPPMPSLAAQVTVTVDSDSPFISHPSTGDGPQPFMTPAQSEHMDIYGIGM